MNSNIHQDAISDTAKVLFGAANDKIMKGLISPLAVHSMCTAKHTIGVALLAAAIVSELSIDSTEALSIVRTSLAHDIGKTAIDRVTLHKPSRLTAQEKETIMEHPVIGFIKYSEITSPTEALPVLLHHRLQAEQYPQNKKINQILKEHELSNNSLGDDKVLRSLTILTVADHFEARYPTPNSTHGYNNRQYSIQDLKEKIRFDLLIRGGFLQKLGLVKLFDIVVDIGAEIANKSVFLSR